LAGQKRKRRVICSSDPGKDRSERMVKMGMRIRPKCFFIRRGQAQVSQFAFLFVMAFLGSLLIFPRLSPQSEQELKDRALLKEMALTPIYDDEKGVRPMYGTIKAEFVVDGTVTEKEGSRETTTTYKANASWTIQYDESGITETKTLSGTENVVIVEKDQDPPLQLTEKTTYSLDPSEAVLMRTYGSKGAGELGVVASEKQKCCWFDIKDEGALKVKTHTEGKWWNGMKYQPFTNDYDENWFIWFDIPSHWQGLAKCLATGKYCSPGVVEGSFSDGKTSGSYSAPVFFARGGAIWEPTLRALGRPVDPSMVQGRDTVSWNLGGKPQEVEAVIITPEDYESWKPEGGKDEETAGNDLQVKVRLQSKGKKDKDTQQKAKFKFELIDTTKEKGVCLNWPAVKAQDTYDLRIEQDKNKDLEVLDGKEGQKAKTKKNAFEAAVTISCFDWGAFARLKVTAILDDGSGSEVLAYLDSDKSKYDLEIPKDADDNYIADAWEKMKGVYGSYAEDDEESSPEGDGDAGDGLTLYEEYRGFMENGKHIFGDPKKKDLFICNKIGAAVEPGIEIFADISGLVVHSKLKPGGRSGPGELDPSRVINLNHTKMAHIVKQHGVFIEKGDAGLASEALPLSGFEKTPGPPKKIEKVKIGLGFLDRGFVPYKLAKVVAHELLHCCSVWHHGEIDLGIRKFQTKTDEAGVKRIFVFEANDDGNDIKTGTPIILYKEPNLIVIPDQPLYSAGIKVWVGRKQGEHSGNTDCVMRYDCAEIYLNNAGDYVVVSELEVMGLSLCTNGQGTGVNEPGRRPEPRYGNATEGKGNCPKQICVNDKYH